mmetsp:Transcript_84257/g.235129  ORF Transcript_84257/g.235129 Transcript_84257/m.235129 type:complete len:357 (+) Transcript_84257:245-1315(+)|eukprot:CAMPEP_0117546748 /NCGR_PEP_ID=MMETSP0784-20121206/46765_1 /TAXON_ID=39447 /ORGANISM="" /LENGTH=356 /DNA_ID=CAMNT_0005343625 /DNA_START=230 /DNA_END=1300 /DNA_ORIENTATION=+
MNAWASKGKFDCHFLCICVLGSPEAKSLAQEMGRQMRLTTCVNGYIDSSKDMPRQGQLGCQGFILLDHEMGVVSAGTSPFMRVRDLAFKHVETLLVAQAQRLPLPKVCPGEFVEVEEPSQRGKQGVCVGISGDLGTVLVMLMDSRKTVQFPASSVKKLQEDDEHSGSEDGNCNGGGCDNGGCKPGSCGQGGKCDPGASCGPRGCGPDGGCELQAGGCSPGAACNDPVPMLEGVPSVKVPSMDHEHEECVVVLNALATERTPATLEAVYNELAKHFEHEEALLDTHGWGGDVKDRFSAKRSHFEDHSRILSKIKSEYKKGQQKVCTQFVKELLQDFADHAERYDGHYAEHLSLRGAQ